MKRALISGIIAAISGAVVQLQPALAAPGTFNDGLRLYGQKRFAEAAQCFMDVTIVEPHNQNAYYYAALCYQHAKDIHKAIYFYKQTVARFPRSEAGRLAEIAMKALENDELVRRVGLAQNMPTARSAGNVSNPPATTTRDNLPDHATVFFDKGDPKLMVTVLVESKPFKMIFDTGATGIVLGKNQLREAGMKVPHGSPVGQSGGSSNATELPYWIMLAKVKFGTIEKQNVPIKVLENNAMSPLLGQDFISDFTYTIDRDAGAIRLTRKASAGSTASKTQSGYTVPFVWEGQKMLVKVDVNGQPYPMWFDTGNSASAVSFSLDDVKKLGLSTEDATEETTYGVSGPGKCLRFYVKRVKLGPIERADVEVLASYERPGRPLVGQHFYEGWQYTIDNDRKLIHFVRR